MVNRDRAVIMLAPDKNDMSVCQICYSYAFVHWNALKINIIFLSDCPFVRAHTPVDHVMELCLNECTQTTFPAPGEANIQFFAQLTLQNSHGKSLNWGRINKHLGQENLRFQTKIAVYFGNGMRQAHVYYGSVTGNRQLTAGSVTVDDLEWP